MAWMRRVFGELLGLFVDDGILAAVVLIWISAIWFLQPHVGQWATALLLFTGPSAILLLSAFRFARKGR